MSKKSKKRNKKYAGWDSGADESTVLVHKVTAINRPPLQQWLHEHRKMLKTVIIAVLVVGAVVALVVMGLSAIVNT
jgi:CHASE3 domain sensor protein